MLNVCSSPGEVPTRCVSCVARGLLLLRAGVCVYCSVSLYSVCGTIWRGGVDSD